jgi:hypothetical protein
MRYKQFLRLLEAKQRQLDELRMNPTTLQQFGASDDAQGIMAGFEAELVFTGLGGEADYDQDPEPDYDADERAFSIQQVIDFFENDEYGYATYGRDLDKLQDGLDEKYMEWSDEKMQDAFRDEREDLIRKVWLDERPMEERVHDYLVEGMDLDDREADRIQAVGAAAPKFNTSVEADAYIKSNPDYKLYIEAVEGAEEILEEDVENSITEQDGYYDTALDDFRDGWYVDDDSGFFTDVGLRYMSDIASEFSLMWPVITYTGQSSEGGWSQDEAERLADDLHEKLGVKTKVSGGYHNATRDDKTWIFEPDSSLDSDDSENMAVEIISPPMPLETCLKQMENFFTWAEENGAYSNSSTGFHMGVSLPHRGGDVDYVKLALFLGDEHVLKEFGRSSNHFCAAAIGKIRQRVRGNKEAVGNAMSLMRSNLLELAQKSLEINNHGFGKYTSINPKGGVDSTQPHKERGAKYIEFRSAGGSNYFEDIDRLKNTLLRYAQAMTIAANPAAERREYYKKLYKLISPPEGDPALDLFSRFATGEISSEELKKSWAEKQLEKEPKGDWKLWDATGKAVPGQEYNGYTKSEAWERAHKKISPGGSMEGFQKEYTLRPMSSTTGDWEVYDVNSGETLETLHGFDTKGAAADSVYDKYSAQGRGFNLRPADPEAPEPELTKRERLAKNIKQAPEETVKNWRVYDTKTGEVHYEQEGRKSSLVQMMRKFERDHKLPQGQLAIKEIPLDPDKQKQDWDVVYVPTGRVIDSILKVDREQAERLLKDVARLHDFENADHLEIRSQSDTPNDANTVPRTWQFKDSSGNLIDQVHDITLIQAQAVKRGIESRRGSEVTMSSVPTAASAERARGQTPQPEQDTSTPPQGFVTQRPATGDYYEVRGGSDNRIYGFFPTMSGHSSAIQDIATAAKRYVNDLTGRDDAFIQYRAGDPVQATAPNGVPMWQVYERDSGNVVHEFADHDQTSAWATAQTWLRDHGAEDPSLFSCRPLMST